MNTPLESISCSAEILIIDDTPENLQLMVQLLTSVGYQVRAYISGNIALQGIKKTPPDLILLDVMMPEISGYEVCQKLKSDPETQDIPVIFISAMNTAIDKVKAFQVGGVDYITKPFHVEEVLARVQIQLENRCLRQSLQAKNQELSEALSQVQETQKHLLQSEKMAALGQLLASIAHEINTPLGAILASSNNSQTALYEFLEKLPQLVNETSLEQKQQFFTLLDCSLKAEKRKLNSREKRQFKREIALKLEEQGIVQARRIADTLIDLEIYEGIEVFFPLFKSLDVDWILQQAYNLISLKINSQNIIMAVERAAKIVFALKSYARYDNSGQKQFVQVTEGLETVLELYRNQISSGIELIRDYQPNTPVWCYPDELNQVWTNLIHNAIHAMQGKGALQISVSERQSYLVVAITDSGQGIPPQVQPRIFEPFFTTKSVGEGSGLGLDIARKIIEKHEGRIEFESQPGQTTFEVWLPMDKTPPSAVSHSFIEEDKISPKTSEISDHSNS
ncbi:response regulator [Lyngbya sp. PCC 8106]|uniref:response regulator n=1 Tax=Lyngbya sp. (strain PCC 8106) TaxID=313612 RepID=UPI0000EAA333|nr:response regulator [Lyngbya sp. PCC 8106]EAW35413.1 two-component sensor histidine kinase [Lyngbya sp. PCC 8106]